MAITKLTVLFELMSRLVFLWAVAIVYHITV